MSESEVKPQVVHESEVRMVGPGHDDGHYISVPIKSFFELKEGDCTYYPTGWKYRVKNTGNSPGKFFYYMSSPRHGVQRLDKVT